MCGITKLCVNKGGGDFCPFFCLTLRKSSFATVNERPPTKPFLVTTGVLDQHHWFSPNLPIVDRSASGELVRLIYWLSLPVVCRWGPVRRWPVSVGSPNTSSIVRLTRFNFSRRAKMPNLPRELSGRFQGLSRTHCMLFCELRGKQRALSNLL